MASEMDHDGTRYTDNITDIAVLYNENDTSSIKVSTKLQEVISPLSATATMVTPQSTPAHIEQTEKNLPKMKGLVIIMTEELQSYAKDIWQRMYKAKRKTDENILTITYNFNGSMSKELTKHEVVDYSDENFSERIKAVLEDWLCNADDSGYGSSTVVIAYELFPLVEPLKSSKKGKVQDIKKIRDIIKTSLEIGDPLAASPNSELKEILSSEYKAEIDSVDMNPLCVKGKVVGERQFRRLKRDSDNKSLGKKFKEYAATKMGRDSIPFEIKIICNKVRESEEAPAVVNFSRSARESVISGVIFDIIKKKEYTPYDFYQTILKYRNDVNDIAAIRSDEDGYNMLHAIIVFNRLNLMLTLVHLKLFSKMIQDTVPLNSPSSFRGHTPRQIAESKRAKRFKDEVTNHERLINSMSRFLKACHDGNKDAALEKLNTQYQQIFERDSMRNNCLYWTIVSGNLDLFKALLDKGAEADNLNEQKENLLHVACMLGHSQFIPILMGRCSMDVTATCNNKRTPLERVAENGDVDSLKELLKANVLLTQCVLPFAASNGRLAFIRYALEDSSTRYMDVDMRDSTGRSALMKACENGKMEIVTYLHGQGAIVTVEDLRRRTALHVACENGHYDVTFWLIEKGADVNAQDCYTGAELCFLIRGKDKGRKAWHYVEVRRNVVHIFLKKTRAGQVDVAVYGTVVKSGWGEDPEKGVVDWVEKMFADRRNRTNAPKDITPLHMAIYKQHTRIARLLIEKGADVNRKDQFGMTPFMYAALRNEKEIAMLLEEKGANLNELDHEQKSALEIAEINEQTEMVNYIRGKTFMDPVKSFIGGPIKKIQQALHPDTLEKLRQDGKDTKMHLIDSLRDLNIDINCLLVSLGSGPIMRVSGEAEPAQAEQAEFALPPARATDVAAAGSAQTAASDNGSQPAVNIDVHSSIHNMETGSRSLSAPVANTEEEPAGHRDPPGTAREEEAPMEEDDEGIGSSISQPQSIREWWSGHTLLRDDRNFLGSGSFGSVYKTKHNGEEVAVKIIDTHYISEYADSKYHDVHQNEIIPFMRKLVHENIIKIYDCKWEGHEMFIMMQLCQGNFHSFCNGAVQMDYGVVCRMISQAAKGLNHLHLNNVVHRNVKPNNFLILLDVSDNPIVKVADFSFAIYLGKQQGSTMSTVRGNRHWLAPELVDDLGKEVDNARYNHSVDVFALGLVIMYAIVNTEGKRFFEKRSFGADVKNNIDIFQRFEGYWRTTNLKDNFLPLLKRMLAKESCYRPKMEEVATQIASFQ